MRKIIVFLILFAFSKALAHDMWINLSSYRLKPSDSISLTVGYGHRYLIPGGEFMKRDDVEKIYAIGPDGKKIPLSFINEIESRSEPILKNGTYLVVCTKKGGFFTKTVQGYKRSPKKGLKGVIYCKYSVKNAKAIFCVGSPKGDVFKKRIGLELEIIPLKDPSLLKAGDYLPIKVLFRGKPLSKEYVFATYAGFSSEKNVFAYATKTDSQGIAKVKILRSGIWLVVVRHSVPYPDPKKCDKISCQSALTFEVK